MKTDSDLQRDVQNQLNWERSIAAAEIGVTAKSGVVTLTGQVPSYFDKIEAEHVAGRVSGVKAIAEEITVKLPGFNERSDADMAHSALNALAWNVAVPHDHAKVKVENGWVTLTGQVDWYFQKAAAEFTVQHLMGVKGVTNSISITAKETVNAAEIKTSIEKAFERTAVADAHKITVTARDGRVTLGGKARSWAERSDAGHMAWSADGVSSVDNNIEVAF